MKLEVRSIERKSVMLDTSFLIRLLNECDPLHNNAVNYFRFFLSREYKLVVSTIAVAEYCVKGNLSDLPLRYLSILPFCLEHAENAGKMISVVYHEKQSRGAVIKPRAVVPNDTKMFAQANFENSISYFVTSDVESKKIYDILETADDMNLSFGFIDITTPFDERMQNLP